MPARKCKTVPVTRQTTMTNQFLPIRHARQLCCQRPRQNRRRGDVPMSAGDAITIAVVLFYLLGLIVFVANMPR